MAATLFSALETQVRRFLLETTANFWSSDELIDILNLGQKDLWGATTDLGLEHYLTVDITNVSQAADAIVLATVPTDVYKVYLIEPRDLSTSSTSRDMWYLPKEYNSPIVREARGLDAQDPTGTTVFYSLSGEGAPVGRPTIHVAPKLSAAVNLSLSYYPVLATSTSASTNPIPGESDAALIAWTVAWARAKERENRAPDPEWLATYGQLKKNLLVSLDPRQVQEPTVVESFFQ